MPQLKKPYCMLFAFIFLLSYGNTAEAQLISSKSPSKKSIKVSTLIGQAASQTKYLAFGDPDHNHLDPYHLARNPEILSALAKENYKSIAIETPLYMQSLIDLYANRKISRLALIHSGDLFFDNAFVDDKKYLGMLVNFIDESKKHGIKIYAVDSAPGILSRENVKSFHAVTSKMAVAWADTISKTPNIAKLPPQDRQTLMQQSFAPFNKEYSAVIAKEQQTQQHRQARGVDMTERYKHDRETAKRIAALGRNGKVAIIYGNLHLSRAKNDRMRGDIDHHLGDDKVTTIDVYYDQQKYADANGGELWRRMADPNSKPLFADEKPLWDKLKGSPDRPEYELDLKREIWTDYAKRTRVNVAFPRGFMTHSPTLPP